MNPLRHPALFCLFLALVTPPGFAGPDPVAARNRTIGVILPAGGIIKGQQCDVILYVADTAPGTVQLELPSPLPGGMRILPGMETVRSPLPEGRVDGIDSWREFLQVRLTMVFSRSGYQQLPPVGIQVGSRTYRTPESLVPVMESRSDATVPPVLEWEADRATVLAGQAVPVRLVLRYLRTLQIPSRMETPTIAACLVEELQETGAIEKEVILDEEFHRMPVASYMITPYGPGTLSLPAVGMDLGGRRLQAIPSSLRVLPLPAGLEDSGAIGNFSITARVTPEQVVVDDQFSVIIQLQGRGNLQYLRMPRMEFRDMALLGSDENLETQAGPDGYEGTRTVEYRLACGEPGLKTFRVPSFRYLDSQGLVQEIPARIFQVRVVTDSRARSAETATSGALEPDRDALQYRSDLFPDGPWFPGVVVPGVILLVLAMGWRMIVRRKIPAGIALGFLAVGSGLLLAAFFSGGFRSPLSDEKRALVDSVLSARDAGDPGTALARAVKLAGMEPDQVEVLVLAGECAMDARDAAQGIWYLSRARRIAPWRSDIRMRLEAVESGAGLDRQLHQVDYPSRTIMALLVLGGLYFCGLLLALGPLEANVLLYSLLFPGILGTLAPLGLDLLASSQARASHGVVAAGGGALRKIPDSEATEWLNLAPGTTMLRLGSSGDFVLVETAFGIQGWIPRERLVHDLPTTRSP